MILKSLNNLNLNIMNLQFTSVFNKLAKNSLVISGYHKAILLKLNQSQINYRYEELDK